MPTHEPKKAALGFIFVSLVFDVLGFGLLIPVLPLLVKQLTGADDASVAQHYGPLASTYALALFLFAPLWGALSDRVGRRPVILLALLGSGIDAFATAFAPSITWLFITRAISGFTGASMSAGMAYIADVTPPEKRAGAYGMVGAAFGIGFVAGPLLGGVLGDINLRLPFMVSGGLMVVSALYGLFILPESLPKEKRAPFELAKANPIGSLWNLSRFPQVLGLAFAIFFVHLAQFGLHATWVLHAEHRYGWKSLQVGLSLAIVGIGAAIVQGGLTRPMVKRLGEPTCILFGLGVGTLAYIGYALASEGWMIYAIVALASIGAVGGPAMQALLTKSVDPHDQGKLQGALSSLQSLAQVFGPLIGAWAFAWGVAAHVRPEVAESGRPYVPGASFLMSAGLAGIGFVIAMLVLRKRRSPAIMAGQVVERIQGESLT